MNDIMKLEYQRCLSFKYYDIDKAKELEKLLKPFHPFDIKYIAPYKENCQNSYIATIIDNENSNSILY